MITDAEIAALEACKSETEWNKTCDMIKNNHGGRYPSDWYATVVLSGLMNRITASF